MIDGASAVDYGRENDHAARCAVCAWAWQISQTEVIK